MENPNLTTVNNCGILLTISVTLNYNKLLFSPPGGNVKFTLRCVRVLHIFQYLLG